MEYGVRVTNRYAFLDDDVEEDPTIEQQTSIAAAATATEKPLVKKTDKPAQGKVVKVKATELSAKGESYSSEIVTKPPESAPELKENIKPKLSFCIRASKPEWATRSSKTIIQPPESPLKAKENVKPEESFCIRPSTPEWATRHFSNNTVELKTYVSSDLNLQKNPPKRRRVMPPLASKVNWDLLISMHSYGHSCLPKKLQQ